MLLDPVLHHFTSVADSPQVAVDPLDHRRAGVTEFPAHRVDGNRRSGVQVGVVNRGEKVDRSDGSIPSTCLGLEDVVTTMREMAGPVPADITVREDIGRPWPNRWSLSEEAVETIIQVARRKDTHSLDRLWRKLLDAY